MTPAEREELERRVRAVPGRWHLSIMNCIEWGRVHLSFSLLSDTKPAPAPSTFLGYPAGSPGLRDAPRAIFCVHSLLLYAHAFADERNMRRIAKADLVPIRGETERAWVDRAGTIVAEWRERHGLK